MADNFTAQIEAWVAKSERRMEAVFRESAQRVGEIAQKPVGAGGNMPVDTGFLRASFQAMLNQPNDNVQFRPEAGGSVQFDESQIALIIQGASIGDTIHLTWTANYAVHVEYGARGRAPRSFARLAAQQWQGIVSQVTAEVKGRVS